MDTVEGLEKRLIEEHAKTGKDARLVERFARAFDTDKAEGETNAAFEERIGSEGYGILEKDLNKSSD